MNAKQALAWLTQTGSPGIPPLWLVPTPQLPAPEAEPPDHFGPMARDHFNVLKMVPLRLFLTLRPKIKHSAKVSTYELAKRARRCTNIARAAEWKKLNGSKKGWQAGPAPLAYIVGTLGKSGQVPHVHVLALPIAIPEVFAAAWVGEWMKRHPGGDADVEVDPGPPAITYVIDNLYEHQEGHHEWYWHEAASLFCPKP